MQNGRMLDCNHADAPATAKGECWVSPFDELRVRNDKKKGKDKYGDSSTALLTKAVSNFAQNDDPFLGNGKQQRQQQRQNAGVLTDTAT